MAEARSDGATDARRDTEAVGAQELLTIAIADGNLVPVNFCTDHPAGPKEQELARSPVVTGLNATDAAPVRIGESHGIEYDAGRVERRIGGLPEVHVGVVEPATGVDTQVEAGPGIGHDHGRLDRHVGCDRRPDKPKRDQRHASQQNLFHYRHSPLV